MALAASQELGWDVGISLKQNQPDLDPSAVRRFAQRSAKAVFSEQRGGRSYQVQLGDTEGLPLSSQDPRFVRVIRSQESLTQNPYREGQTLAFTLCSAFIDCRSKLVRRYGLTAIEVASVAPLSF